jgi:hypothetical protein
MNNHMTRTWDHKRSKPLGPKLLSLGHHLDDFFFFLLFSPLDFYYLIPKQLHFILIPYLFIFLHFNRLFYFTLYFNFEFFLFFSHINDINFNLIKEIIKNPKKSMQITDMHRKHVFFLKKIIFKKN